jgi:fatty acid desaturase
VNTNYLPVQNPQLPPKSTTWKTSQNNQQLLSTEELKVFNTRSNLRGFAQLSGHLAVIGMSGYLWGTQWGNWGIALPSLVIYGISLAFMFAPLHECVHRTAFANQRLNDTVAWCAGLLSFYNSTFFRRYHKWHHRYTQIPGKDPELEDPKPTNLGEYLWQISGLPWWRGKITGYWRIARGNLDGYPYIPETARDEVIRSTRLQLGVYGIAIALSFYFAQPWFILYWALPLAVGQPFLRAILLAEHSNCTEDGNPLTNTRTTLTLFPVRFLMWNMPFHAEHHLYTSIPFHALAKAHQTLSPHFQQVESGYINVNRQIIGKFYAKDG